MKSNFISNAGKEEMIIFNLIV